MSAAPVHANGFCTKPCEHDAPNAAEVEACRTWIRVFATPRASLNTRVGSYQLKHAVERASQVDGVTYLQTDRWGRQWSGSYRYISNGAFIEAARLEGYRVVRIGNGPNAYFNMSFRRRVG